MTSDDLHINIMITEELIRALEEWRTTIDSILVERIRAQIEQIIDEQIRPRRRRSPIMFDLEDDEGKMQRIEQGTGNEPMLSQPIDLTPALSRSKYVTIFAEAALLVMQHQYPSNTRIDHLQSILAICNDNIWMPSPKQTQHYRPIKFFDQRLEFSVFELAHGATLLLLAEESITSEQRTELERSLATTFAESHPDPRSTDGE